MKVKLWHTYYTPKKVTYIVGEVILLWLFWNQGWSLNLLVLFSVISSWWCTNCIFAFIILLEPRGAQEDFENVLKDYYDTIRQGNKPTTTGRRRGKKVDASGCSATTREGNIKKGATFLAVCRGKVFWFPAKSKS